LPVLLLAVVALSRTCVFCVGDCRQTTDTHSTGQNMQIGLSRVAKLFLVLLSEMFSSSVCSKQLNAYASFVVSLRGKNHSVINDDFYCVT